VAPKVRRPKLNYWIAGIGVWLSMRGLLLFTAVCLASCDGGAGGPQTGEPQHSRPSAGDPVASPPRSAAGVATPTASLQRSDLPDVTEEMRENAADQVMGSCSRCHAPLPADVLPRHAWEKVILSMAEMVGEWGQPAASPEELAIALHWYEKNAPESLEFTRHLPEVNLQFETIELTPRGLEKERIPAVSDLLRFEQEDRSARGILVSELRSRRLMLLPLGPAGSMPLIPFLPAVDFRYPASLSHGDLDGVGGPDLLIASIGGMNPGNEIQGGAWLAQSGQGRWSGKRVGDALARACDLKGQDLDGDGDVDLVACAFGFRGPGQLLWLENQEGEYSQHQIDRRDGFVAVEVEDVDGDGDADLIALLSQHHEMVMQFTNDGSGNFTPQVLLQWPHAAWGSSGMELVDLDGDGDRDLVLVNGDTLDDNTPKPTHGVRWLERIGSTFTTLHEILRLPGCERAAVGDLDGDGDLDVVGAAFMPQVDPATWKNWDSLVWAENQGNARKWQVRTLEVGNPVHSAVLIEDVDQDGAADIVLGNYVWLRSDHTPSARRDYLTVWRRSR